MKRLILYAAILVVLTIPAMATAASTTLDAVADTWVFFNNPSSTHGGETALTLIRTLGWYADPLVRFDLSSLAGDVVTSATLRLQLYYTQPYSTGVGSTEYFDICKMVSTWDEYSARWTNIISQTPPTFDPSSPIASYSGTYLVTSGSVPIDINIPVSVIQSWITDPSTNFGLILVPTHLTNDPSQWNFASHENTDFTGPQLIVTTSSVPSVPEPSSLILIGIGLMGLIGFRVKMHRN